MQIKKKSSNKFCCYSVRGGFQFALLLIIKKNSQCTYLISTNINYLTNLGAKVLLLFHVCNSVLKIPLSHVW